MKSTYYLSPIGLIQIQGTTTHITHIQFAHGTVETQCIASGPQTWSLGKHAIQQLSEYFAGKRTEFTLPLHPQGSDFQQLVWNALQKIPYGQTRTYGEIALQIGNPKAARAVGLANNRNPLAIIIPCHRVIGANGNLTGYAGGLDCKAFLLNLEQKLL
jgi:methylated-DNA-[protein]-cysteine S-methyltransferase